jgi:hypothetical protein
MRYQSPQDYDLDAHAEQAVTLGVESTGLGAQTLGPIPDVIWSRSFDVTGAEAANTVPLKSMVVKLNIVEVANRLIIGPSARNERVVVNFGEIEWTISQSGVYFPNGLFNVPPSSPTQIFAVPAMRAREVSVCIYPAAYVQGFKDAVRIGWLYEPDTRERVIAGYVAE